MGSKSRHAKEILPIILNQHDKDMWYIEPFVGGANIMDKVYTTKRVGVDINKYLIAMWNAILAGWEVPEYIDKSLYNKIRSDIGNYPEHLVGWVAHGCSYNGKWFGGFAGKIITKEGKHRNYQEECKRDVMKQKDKLLGCRFIHDSVFNINQIKEKSTVYCDPPYRNTTKYKDAFDHDSFYEWCRRIQSQGHVIYISEYWMPSDFKCVWEKEVNSSLTLDTGSKKNIERLFTL